MFMHRRRRSRRNRRSGLGSWLDAIIPDSVKGPVKKVKMSASTRRALKAKADAQSKLDRELSRGSECCPVIRVKCERRTVQAERPVTKTVRSYDYAKEKFVRSKVKGTEKYDKKVRLCSVSAGSHKGDLLSPKEARSELNALKRLLGAENCKVRTAGDKLGGK